MNWKDLLIMLFENMDKIKEIFEIIRRIYQPEVQNDGTVVLKNVLREATVSATGETIILTTDAQVDILTGEYEGMGGPLRDLIRYIIENPEAIGRIIELIEQISKLFPKT